MRLHLTLAKTLHTTSLDNMAAIKQAVANAHLQEVPVAGPAKLSIARPSRAVEKVLADAKRCRAGQELESAAMASVEKIKEEAKQRVNARASLPSSVTHERQHQRARSAPVLSPGRLTRLNSSRMPMARFVELSERRANVVNPALEIRMAAVLRARASRLGTSTNPMGIYFDANRLTRLRSTGMSPERHTELAEKRLHRR